MKNISILGSTGSIGSQTLEIVSRYPEKFRIIGLSAATNIDKLHQQILIHKPAFVSVADKEHANELSSRLKGSDVRVLYGNEGYREIATYSKVDMVVSSMVGASGLEPTHSAILAGKDIALANKESLVVAGEILIEKARKSGSKILPVDSEHSALFQLISKNDERYIKRLIITASGGPFRTTPASELEKVTVERALDHPTWNMGSKITIDSATLMNKGFEIIEAARLFDLEIDDISVWIHPQSIVHSMVEYIDGSFISQLSTPDMKIPIAYALSYPERIEVGNRVVLPADFSNLTFEDVDTEKFNSIGLAKEALAAGGTMPAVLNAANETAVHAFLNKQIKFTEIMRIVELTMNKHELHAVSSLVEIYDADAWARSYAKKLIKNTGDYQ